MKRSMQGRRLLVTGASGGIGRAIVVEAVKQGARVAFGARSEDRIDELARELTAQGADVLGIRADVTSDADRRNLLDAAVSRFGGLDALINNAGVASFGHFVNSTEEVLRQIMDTNFFGPAELTRLAIPVLAQGHEPAVLFVASMTGRRGIPAWPEYSASKCALVGLAEALRAEMVRYNIDVLTVLPGLTNSNLPANFLRREGRMKIEQNKGMTPEYVAQQILTILAKNRKETILGFEAKWILRVCKFFPRLSNILFKRKIRKLYAQPAPAGEQQAVAR